MSSFDKTSNASFFNVGHKSMNISQYNFDNINNIQNGHKSVNITGSSYDVSQRNKSAFDRTSSSKQEQFIQNNHKTVAQLENIPEELPVKSSLGTNNKPIPSNESSINKDSVISNT